MKLKPLIKLEILGLNQENIFNNFIKQKIDTYDIKRLSYSKTIFKISPDNLAKTKKILENNQAKLTNTKFLGLYSFYKNFLLRLGITFGILTCLILCVIANFFILKIEIMGNEIIKTSQIIEYLANQNICVFSSKNVLDTEQIELDLMDNFNEISMISVIEKGTTLIINIKEKPENNEYVSGKYENLVSTFNGRITEFQLVSGTPLKNVGDIVKVGDVLVQSTYVDSAGNIQNIKAEAHITAEVWYEGRTVHYDSVIQTLPTGEETKFYEISLMGLTIFSNKKANIYEKFEENIIEKSFVNSILPIKIKYFKYTEMASIEIVTDFNSVKDELINDCKQIALQQVCENDTLISENCSITEELGYAKICYLVTVNKIIM